MSSRVYTMRCARCFQGSRTSISQEPTMNRPYLVHSSLRLAGALLLLGVGACFSKRVTRIEPTAVTDLSGRWNDTDSRLVANQLVEQTRAAGWAKRYTDLHGGEAPA